MYKCPADEGSRGCIGNGPRRVADGRSCCFGFIFPLVADTSVDVAIGEYLALNYLMLENVIYLLGQ